MRFGHEIIEGLHLLVIGMLWVIGLVLVLVLVLVGGGLEMRPVSSERWGMRMRMGMRVVMGA